MINSILFNIEAIFFPIKYKNLRDNRQNHLTETLAVLWPIMIISSLWELLILTLRPGQLNHYITFFILLKTFIFFAMLLCFKFNLTCHSICYLIANKQFTLFFIQFNFGSSPNNIFLNTLPSSQAD